MLTSPLFTRIESSNAASGNALSWAGFRSTRPVIWVDRISGTASAELQATAEQNATGAPVPGWHKTRPYYGPFERALGLAEDRRQFGFLRILAAKISSAKSQARCLRNLSKS